MYSKRAAISDADAGSRHALKSSPADLGRDNRSLLALLKFRLGIDFDLSHVSH